ncbi:hypothetical protein ScPMuIL_016480 [Solemya velum]
MYRYHVCFFRLQQIDLQPEFLRCKGNEDFSISLNNETSVIHTMENEKIERLRERILVCPICMDEYKDPRILSCHHSVCMQCLLDYVRASSSTGRMFRCPQCRADVCVPRGGIKDFPPNFYVNCIQDELGSKPYFGICDVCERDWLVSQYRCVDCDLDICKFCIHEHRLFRHNAGKTNIMRIETGNVPTHFTPDKACGSHKDETLQMFCSTCQEPVCVTCVCEEHKQHDTMPLVKKFNHMQKMLQFEFDDQKLKIKEVNSVLTSLDKLSESMSKNSDDVTKYITEQTGKLTEAIEKLAETRVQQITGDHDRVLRDVSAYTKELRCYLDQLEKGSNFLENLQDGDMSLELLTCYSKYKQGLEVMKKATRNKTIGSVQYNFEPGKHIEGFNFFGAYFGSLHRNKRKETFLADTKPAFNFKVKWRPNRYFTVDRFVYMVVHCSVLLGIWGLLTSLFKGEGKFIETSCALIFCVYIMITSWFAFRKRQTTWEH